MGLCFSKRRQQEKQPVPPPSAGASAKSKKPSKAAAVVVADEKAKKTPQPKRAGEPDKKAVSVVKTKAAAAVDAKKEETRPLVVLPTGPVRTSSCTKEEVDAILIQCGRLSRSSSGTGRAGSGDTGGGHHRRRSGSKRSYDFDQECDWEKHGVAAPSRPSPHRSSPQRKRSGSRERTGGGASRRASRSPGRRVEGASSAATASSGGASRQPAKMVSVPAREKGRAPSPAAAASAKRCPSPRSSSPARVAAGNDNAGGGQETAGPTPALSRSSSRKAEQSPYRRSPMVELDENSLRNRNSNDAKPQKKSMEAQKASERPKEKQGIAEHGTAAASEARAPASKSTATRTVSTNVVAEPHNPRSGCRSSRDFDQNPNLYATQLLEDIQNYHNASAGTPPSFSLPACVSKACSIVEAVADLNSSSSETRTCEPARSADDKASVNAPPGGDEPSVHRYVSVRDIRGEAEPQESAGSNSVSGNLWTPSCDRNSVESTDRTWSTSRSNNNNGDEVVEQGSHGGGRSPLNRPRQSKQRPAQQEHSSRSRAGSSGVNVNRGRDAHRGSGSVAGGRSAVRAV